MRKLLSLALLFGLVPSPCQAEAPATIATDNGKRVMGYYIAPDSTQLLTANTNAVWATRNGFAGDCSVDVPLSSCLIATACSETVVSYDDGSDLTCISPGRCFSFTIFQTSPGGGPVATNFACREGWAADTIYRQLVQTMTTSSSSSSSSSSSPVPTSSSHIASSTSVVASHTPTAQPASDGSSSSSSVIGAAVGATVGGLALIAAAVVAFYFLTRRRPQRSARYGHSITQYYPTAELGTGAGTPFLGTSTLHPSGPNLAPYSVISSRSSTVPSPNLIPVELETHQT